ncbi:helix-turn-helix domain-containing protein [Flammeovirga sp. OC4]|uniref:helix-turn-helix domain-containing protein n=1 Tax=Flammeovirga sp. OC4 TaxID=1382345 RepID=UPI0005C4BC6A|nr:helix-turn-helix domain-containing protein [Flammeovirga sp. OC4]
MNNRTLHLFYLLLIFLNFPSFSNAENGEMVFKIIELPEFTPDSADIYLASSLNQWSPNDEKYKFKRSHDGYYYLKLPRMDESFQYKFTRGSWESVESTENGDLKPNRYYDPESPSMIEIQIYSWQDLANQMEERIQLIVTELPEATPYDASLFVVGDFNNWKPLDLESKMVKHSDGFYYLTLPTGLRKFEYKITRGSWESVEGRENGRAIPNRVYDVAVDGWKKTIKIRSWEDLSGSTTTPYMFLLLLGAFQGLLLIFSIFGIQENNRRANVVLAVLILFTSIALMSRVAMYYRDIFQMFPKIYLIPEMLLLIYGPLFFIYIKQLTESESKSKEIFVRLIPFGIQVLAYLPLFALSNDQFEYGVLNKHYEVFFNTIGGLGLIFSAYYWWKCKWLLRYQHHHSMNILSEERNINYLNGVMLVYATCLAIWSLMYVVGIGGVFFDYSPQNIINMLTDTLWLIIACISFIMGYYAMNQPEILRVAEEEEIKSIVEAKVEEEVEEKAPQGLTEEQLLLKEKLAQEMNEHKLYTNSRLTLPELAHHLKTSTHDISKVINDGYQKNFYDFINGYRINAFIEEVNKDTHQELTYLGHAYNVGFNSKTAFNRAFKKEKKKTPTQFFQQLVSQ